MNKFFTLLFSLIMLSALNVKAQTWDFTKGWSDATKANIMADAATWSVNRGTAEAPTGWKNAVAVSGYLKANGQAIAELEGLEFLSMPAGNLLLDASSIRWSKKDQGVTIHGIQNGQTITIKAKSANSTADNRSLISKTAEAKYISGPADGIVYGGSATSETALAELANAENGIFTLVWAVETDNAEGIDVTLCCGPNGGIDLQLIKVSGASAEEDKNVAWVSADPTNDMYRAMAPTTGINYTDIAASTTMTEEELRAFDAVVVSTDVDPDSPMARLISDNVAYQPIVNLNTKMFYYEPVDAAGSQLTVTDKSSDVFTGIEVDENGSFDYTNIAIGLPYRFEGDDVLARNGDAVAIHQHTPKRNSYILIPSDPEYNAAATAAWPILVGNAISTVAATKRDIVKTGAPTYTLSYADGKTTVTITSATTGAWMRYCINDGEWDMYTQPIVLTEPARIYAISSAEGYKESDAISKDVDIQTQAAAPAISVATEEGKAVITITADEGAAIYYNFTGSEKQTESSLYAEPIEVAENCTITAIASVEGKITSAATTQAVEIPGLKPMQKVLGHFDANKAQWSNGESKAYYYCYGYDDGTGTKYKKYNVSNNYTVTYAPEGSEWKLSTSGQQVVWESTGPQKNIGDVSNYNPVRAIDVIENEITSGEITVGNVATYTGLASDGVTDSTYNDPQTFELVSTVKYQAPFNIVSYIGCKPGKVGFEYYVSTDNENWTLVSTSPEGPAYDDAASKWRLWHRDLIQYNGTDAVYLKVKSISNDTYRIFDIFIKGEGELDAIQEVAADNAASVRKYTANGQILIQTPRGTFTATGARVK